MRKRKTDYGTIILHWLLVAAFGVAFVTGMRIATEAPERSWINSFDAVLPQNVWVMHMQAAVVLLGVAFAYTIYVRRSGLGRRIRLDKVRLRGLVGRGQARRGAVNILLYWVFFVTMLALMASGGLMYFGYFAGYDVATLHWYATWVVLGFSGLHVLSHLRIGGTSQLLRIFRPTGLSAPPPQLDAIELLTMLAEQSARLQPESGGADKTASETRMQPVQHETRGCSRSGERRRCSQSNAKTVCSRSGERRPCNGSSARHGCSRSGERRSFSQSSARRGRRRSSERHSCRRSCERHPCSRSSEMHPCSRSSEMHSCNRSSERHLCSQHNGPRMPLAVGRLYGVRQRIRRRDQRQKAERRNRETRRSNPILLSLPRRSRSPVLRSSSQPIGWPSTSCSFTVSAAPMRPSSTATHPIEPGEASSHSP